MLTIQIINDGKGTNENANYRYNVFINNQVIKTGKINGHNRNDGWAKLLKEIAEENLKNERKE